jgi:hypothetical protein
MPLSPDGACATAGYLRLAFEEERAGAFFAAFFTGFLAAGREADFGAAFFAAAFEAAFFAGGVGGTFFAAGLAASATVA